MKYISNKEEDTLEIAKEFSASLKPSDVVCLNGGLGSGKTAFVKGLVAGLGYLDIISSPTFTIVNEYYGKMPIYHFDVYRISDLDEMYEIGFEEYVCGDGVCVIEWAELIREILPHRHYNITIKKNISVGEDYREIYIDMRDTDENTGN